MIEHSMDVIGIGFRMKKDVREQFARIVQKKSLRVDLRREPDNKYDENAIAVWCLEGGPVFEERHIGYLGRETAAVLAPKLDSGDVVVKSAKLTALYTQSEWKNGNLDVTLETL